MPEEVSISEDGKYILIRSHGEPSLEHLEQALHEVMEIHRQRRIDKALVDSRGRESLPRTVDGFEGGALLARVVGYHIRFAVVVSHSPGAHQLFENVAVNRGAYVRFFENMESAREWLLADPRELNADDPD
jgi:hypothetical protein